MEVKSNKDLFLTIAVAIQAIITLGAGWSCCSDCGSKGRLSALIQMLMAFFLGIIVFVHVMFKIDWYYLLPLVFVGLLICVIFAAISCAQWQLIEQLIAMVIILVVWFLMYKSKSKIFKNNKLKNLYPNFF